MNVLVLAPYRYDTAPGQRFRIEQWMPLLEDKGVHFEFDAFMSEKLHEILYKPGNAQKKATLILSDYVRRLRRILAARRYDVVFLHREAAMIGPAWIERLLKWSGVPFIYEFDDAIYVAYVSPANKYLSYLKFPQKTATICKLASHVIVGNEVLAEYARRRNPNVTIVPTTIDTDKYRPACRYEFGDDVPVIGWSGSYSSVQYLDAVKPAFARLAEKYKFHIEVIGADWKFDGGPNVKVHSRPWRALTEVADLSRLHIGLMPLPDEDWARGKCALKALQYMALGIPTVVSPVGVNKDVIRDGDNGLWATTTDEWYAALSRLLDDVALRRRLGTAGIETVEREYSARVWAPRVLAILEEVAARRAKAA